MVRILIMLSKLATSGLLKVKLLLNTSYDNKCSVYDVTNKVLPHGSSYNVDVVTRQSFL